MNLPSQYQGSELTTRPPSSLAIQLAPNQNLDRLNLRALLSLIRRQWLLIAIVVSICFGLALIVTQNTPRLYTASADILLKATTKSVIPDSDQNETDGPRGSEQIETEIQFIQSRELAGRVYDRLKLAEDAVFLRQMVSGGRLDGFMRLIGQGREITVPPPGSEAAKRLSERAINTLKGGLTVRRISNSSALRLSISNPNPDIAARVANGYARAYSDNQVEEKVAASRAAVGILGQRMEELRRQAQSDFSAVQQYRIQNELQSKSGTSLTEQEISAYNQQVAMARAEASQDASRLAAARSRGSLGDSTTSATVIALRSQRAALSIRVAELSERYLPSHPDLATARQQLADIDAQIGAEVGRAVSTLAATAQASAARLKSLEGSLGGATGKLDRNNQALINLDDLERRANASQALYESYLNRYKEVVARSGAEQPNSTVISAAVVPGAPSSPNLMLNLTLGLLIGALVGTGAAIAVEGAYSGMTTAEDVEQRLLVRCIGLVPLIKSLDAHAETALATIAAHPGGAFTEAIRSVLTACRQSSNSRNQVIAVTSALPEEGKSTLAAALAYTAAMAQERIAIIDCDAVRRHLSVEYGGPPSAPGLGQLFAGEIAIDAFTLSQALGGATLFAITTPFAPGARLLEQGKLHRLIAQLRERFDLIILDCGPILPIAETRDLVALADNAIVVTRWRATSDREVRAALKLLPLNSLGDIGVVLNAIDLRQRLRFGDGDPELFSKKYKQYYASRPA
ncbi:MAG: GumC family protein [Sphingomonadaceae bacterium]